MKHYAKVIENTEGINSVKKVVVSLSGGLDSTTLLYLMVERFGAENVYALSFDYNQRHNVELHQARRSAHALEIDHRVIDISFLGKMASGVSSMVQGDVPTPAVDDILGDPQPTTYMPNRNMVLASITASFAESVGADAIALGIQRIDSYGYWDTTPEFYAAVEAVLRLNRKHPIRFLAPFLSLDKSSEILLGVELSVPFEQTWTCYSPNLTPGTLFGPPDAYAPCGVCPSCCERAEGFRRAGLEDPLESVSV